VNDDDLLLELGAAVREGNAVPASFLAAGRGAFAWRSVDADLATLAADADPAHVRAAEPAQLRSFTLQARELSIEVEVTGDALVGQVVPPAPGRVALQTARGEPVEAAVDELGWFTLRPLPSGMFRLHLRPSNGSAVVTEWLTL
jgi:hypothetical protein